MQEFKGAFRPRVMHDVGIKAKGPMEDQAYLKNPKIQNNIRRGNTIIEGVDGSLVIARKGLTKFYDIKREFIQADYRHDYGVFLQVSKEDNSSLRDYTMGPLYQTLQAGD
jgi:hypothetical protein